MNTKCVRLHNVCLLNNGQLRHCTILHNLYLHISLNRVGDVSIAFRRIYLSSSKMSLLLSIIQQSLVEDSIIY